MTCLITGANGFLGSSLTRQLVSSGENVIAMVRQTSNLRRLDDLRDKIEIRYASLQDYPTLLKAMEGVDCVYHLAANVRLGSFRKKELFRDNVLGSENVFRAARELKTDEIIYVSSISIFGSAIDEVVSENNVGKGKIMSTYGQTKLASYYKFKEAYNSGLNIKAAIPSNIFGQDDPNFGPLFKNFVQKHLKIMAGNMNANMGMIFIDDVCRGIIQVAKKGTPGHSYILNSDNLTLRELLRRAEEVTGIKAPRHRIPKPVVKSAALLSELTGRIIRNNMLLNRQSARLLYTTHPIFDSTKAQNELGWTPTDFNKAFSETLKWYMDKYSKKRKGKKV